VSFADPLVLLALLAIPALAIAYAGRQRRRARAAAAFVAPSLSPSVAPSGPGWRRHAPMLAFAAALAVLIVAAARPQRSVARAVTGGAVILADDISGSMQATDVVPSRERAAQRAGALFIARVPATVQVGVIEFARAPIVLQSPTPDHALAARALSTTPRFGGGTAIGRAILAATQELQSVPRVDGHRVPGAIVLISDGGSNVGVGAVAAARQAAALHIPVYTVSVGTPSGAIEIRRGNETVRAAVPVARGQLRQIAAASGGKSFEASDAAGVDAAYRHLAARLGHRRVTEQITQSFAGAGLVLLLIGGAMSLSWFGRLA
jgi:Ca-activated chloride channel family protein